MCVGRTGLHIQPSWPFIRPGAYRYRILAVSLAYIRWMVFLPLVEISEPSFDINGGRQLKFERKEEWDILRLLGFLQNHKDHGEEKSSICLDKGNPENKSADTCQMVFFSPMVNISAPSVDIINGDQLRLNWEEVWSIPSLLGCLLNYKEEDCGGEKNSISPSACPAEPCSGGRYTLPQIDSSSPPGNWSQKKNKKKNKIPEKHGFQPLEWTGIIEPEIDREKIPGFTGSEKNWVLFDEETFVNAHRDCLQKAIKTPIQQQKEPTPELDAPALETKMQNAEEALKRHEKEAQVKAEEAKADAVRAKEGQVQAKIFANAMENGQRAKVMPTEDDALRASYKAAIVQNEATKDGAKEAKNLRDGKECKQQ